jgi:hypothetical protein
MLMNMKTKKQIVLLLMVMMMKEPMLMMIIVFRSVVLDCRGGSLPFIISEYQVPICVDDPYCLLTGPALLAKSCFLLLQSQRCYPFCCWYILILAATPHLRVGETMILNHDFASLLAIPGFLELGYDLSILFSPSRMTKH